MWTAWAILASVGIMSSAFRWILPSGPVWFYIHRGVQTLVVLLTAIGFVIAVIFTQKKDKPHFENTHMIVGLVVVIVAVLQPMNALCRGHPAGTNEQKTLKRGIWEVVHKLFGYGTWILGCYAAMLGLQLMGKDRLADLHLYVWCAVLLAMYIGLTVIGCFVTKGEGTNENKSNAVCDDENDSLQIAEDDILDTSDFEEEYDDRYGL